MHYLADDSYNPVSPFFHRTSISLATFERDAAMNLPGQQQLYREAFAIEDHNINT